MRSQIPFPGAELKRELTIRQPILFNVIFPRARTYRVWVQFQRKGVVNTAHFDIPVKQLGQ
jgi:hypothetical protein